MLIWLKLQLHLIKFNSNTNISKPTGRGLILLGENPQLTFPQARIQFLIEQEGQDPITKEFEGPVLLQPILVQDYLEIIYPKYISRKTLQRKEYYNLPIEAIREMINNAIAHRDYSIRGASIKIYIDDEKIEVHSPGQPIHSIEKFRDLNVPPISRNPKIAYLLNQMGVVEEMGFGMKELRKLNNERNLPHPSYRMNDHYFIITLYLKTGVYKPATDLMDNLKKLNSKENKGYDILADRKQITSSEYQTIMKVSERTARNHLNKMVELGLIFPEHAGKYIIYKLKV